MKIGTNFQGVHPSKTCGSTSHGADNRASKCPAWGKVCNNCNIPNNFAAVCRRATTVRNVSNINLVAHVAFNAELNQFTIASNQLTDEIPAHLTPIRNVYGKHSKLMYIFPDSGATICIAGTKHMNDLNISVDELKACTKRIVAVGGTPLKCKGWLPVKFEVDNITTEQPLYICEQVDRIYFSKQGCIDTNIIPASFPYPMKEDSQHVRALDQTECKPEPTKRENPPPRPATLPYPPKPENIKKLQNYIVDKFSSTTFNNAAPFPQMATVPAHIHLKQNAIPYARHSPIPVPHHWKAEVKCSLDRDVERGIIEQVPIGTPVEWYAPMIIVSKKDGSPRRTIDLQRLNSQCLRETHHVQAPFQLALQIPSDTYIQNCS